MKLLLALCDALGFEVEDIEDLIPDRNCGGFRNGKAFQGRYEIVDYKLTKKEPVSCFVPIEVQSDEWGAITQYVTAHVDDIKNNINDYGDLMPVWEFFNRNS